MLPLGLVSALPALVNCWIILTKETVVLSIITVPELMYQVQAMSAETFRFLEADPRAGDLLSGASGRSCLAVWPRVEIR